MVDIPHYPSENVCDCCKQPMEKVKFSFDDLIVVCKDSPECMDYLKRYERRFNPDDEEYELYQ